MAGIYNIVYRYLFDRHRDLPLPTSFLIDDVGNIVKVYQGTLHFGRCYQETWHPVLAALRGAHSHRALPFPGTLHQDAFQRNAFTLAWRSFSTAFLTKQQQLVSSKSSPPIQMTLTLITISER